MKKPKKQSNIEICRAFLNTIRDRLIGEIKNLTKQSNKDKWVELEYSITTIDLENIYENSVTNLKDIVAIQNDKFLMNVNEGQSFEINTFDDFTIEDLFTILSFLTDNKNPVVNKKELEEGYQINIDEIENGD